MRTETHTRKDARRYGDARAHRDAHPDKKRAAYDNGVTTRTERRWGSPVEAQGSPQDQYTRFLWTAQDAWRLLAHNKATVKQKTLARMSDSELIARIHELDVADVLGEGEDNATRLRRGVSPEGRAMVAERDAALDLELAAAWREIGERGLTDRDVDRAGR